MKNDLPLLKYFLPLGHNTQEGGGGVEYHVIALKKFVLVFDLSCSP
jgi:hypothetical protein